MPAKRVVEGEKVVVPKRRLKLKYIPIAKLKRWKKNPRRNDAAAENLLGLLKQHGFIDPIIATPDRVIRAGHTRLKAAQKTDLDELPVIFVDFDTEEQAEMYALGDNRANEWATWDEDVLVDLLGKRRKLPDDMMAAQSGFEQSEIEGLREGFVEPDPEEPGEADPDSTKISFVFTEKQAAVVQKAIEKHGPEKVAKRIVKACRRG